jgi:hypothetical protein
METVIRVNIYLALVSVCLIVVVVYSSTEWNGIAKKDAITIYDHHEVPKTNLGFGTKLNPVPQAEVELIKTPMKDDIWFKSSTKLRQVHQPLKPVPYGSV